MQGLRNLSTGLHIIENDTACVKSEWAQVKFPKSKKKRIRKKWAKKHYNYAIVERHTCFQFGDKLLVSKRDYDRIKAFEDSHSD